MLIDTKLSRFPPRAPKPKLRGPYGAKGFPHKGNPSFFAFGHRWTRRNRPDPAMKTKGFRCVSVRVPRTVEPRTKK